MKMVIQLSASALAVPSYFTNLTKAHAAYKAFCSERGLVPLSYTSFAGGIQKSGFYSHWYEIKGGKENFVTLKKIPVL